MEQQDYSERGGEEVRALSGIIYSTTALGQIAAKWDDKAGFFSAPLLNDFGRLAVAYYREHGKAPFRKFRGVLESLAAERGDDFNVQGARLWDTVEGIRRNEGKPLAKQVVLLTGKVAKRNRVRRAIERAEGLLDRGKVESAEKELTLYSQVDLGRGARKDPLTDDGSLFRAAFEREQDPLITYDGALGQFFGSALHREGFIIFCGSDKAGKSYWMLDVALQALKQRRRVAMFECGDLGQEEAVMRFGVRIAQRPEKASSWDWPCKINVPVSIKKEKDADIAEVEWKEKKFDRPLTCEDAMEARQRFMEKQMKSRRSWFSLESTPNSTSSVSSIKSTLQSWARDGWIADVVIVDYLDILDHELPRMDLRHQIDGSCRGLRRLAQEMNCLVITASQMNKEGGHRQLTDRRHFSEAKTKLAHATGVIGINVFGEEKKNGLCRLNWWVKRKGRYTASQVVHVAGCLELARPAIVSCW